MQVELSRKEAIEILMAMGEELHYLQNNATSEPSLKKLSTYEGIYAKLVDLANGTVK